MAFVSEMVDQLRVFLNDAGDTQVTFATKKLFLNRGIRMLWPSVYSINEITLELTQGLTEYSLSAAIADGYVISAEISLDGSGDEYSRFYAYDILPGDEDETPNLYIRDPRLVATTGRWVRFMFAAPIPIIAASTYAASQSEVWDGPDRALNLPVLYAMGMLTLGKVDDRQDHTRYSTTQAVNGVSDQDLLGSSQVWLNQYYAELESLTRPLPPTRD